MSDQIRDAIIAYMDNLKPEEVQAFMDQLAATIFDDYEPQPNAQKQGTELFDEGDVCE